MKIPYALSIFSLASLGCALISGCSTSPSHTTSSYHPGPVTGRGVGTAVGAAAGNAVAGGVAFHEGLVSGAAASFDTATHVVRKWRTETTSDGRTIQVPEDILVDANGQPINPPAKK